MMGIDSFRLKLKIFKKTLQSSKKLMKRHLNKDF